MARIVKSLAMPAKGYQHREHRAKKSRTAVYKTMRRVRRQKQFLVDKYTKRRSKDYKVRL